jgi:dTDP-4-amino-4,6-dideoxygalactose transaminase
MATADLSMTRSTSIAPAAPVRFQAPSLPLLDDVNRYYSEAERVRWFSNGGPCATMLAERLAAQVGAGVEAVPVANCTVGLLVALRAVLGTPSGRRRLVAVPSFTFVATAVAVRWAGFEPLWVDVDPDGWHVDVPSLERALAQHRSEVAGVLGCSTFGTPPPAATRAAVAEVAGRHGSPVVYDSAAGWGATDEAGIVAGRAGVAEVFSFHATKPLAAGEGGAVTTADPEVAERVRALTNFGFDPARNLVDVGINAKMSELHAAVALAALDRYDATLAARRQRAAFLRAGLEPHGWRFQAGAAGSTYQHVPAVAPDGATRDLAVARAVADRVELRCYFDPPLHREAVFDGAARVALDTTDDLASRIVSLPMADDLPVDALERIVAACRI